MVHPNNACKMGFAYQLWLPFIDQSQSDVVIFAIITFHICNILVTKFKHGIAPNGIISFNE